MSGSRRTIQASKFWLVAVTVLWGASYVPAVFAQSYLPIQPCPEERSREWGSVLPWDDRSQVATFKVEGKCFCSRFDPGPLIAEVTNDLMRGSLPTNDNVNVNLSEREDSLNAADNKANAKLADAIHTSGYEENMAYVLERFNLQRNLTFTVDPDPGTRITQAVFCISESEFYGFLNVLETYVGDWGGIDRDTGRPE